MITPLTLTQSVMHRIDAATRAAGSLECLGLLASAPGADAITSMQVLPSRASVASAEAAPLAIKHAADALAARGLIARGLWHSHGHLPVFHSGTDRATLQRVLPAMAPAAGTRACAIRVPAVEAPDAAVLPLADGRCLSVVLIADPIAGTEFCEPLRWTHVTVGYGRTGDAPSATLAASGLVLAARGVVLSLGIPDGARVEMRMAERALARVAALYSLVVNTRRDRYAQCLLVADVGGERFTRLADCDVVVRPDGGMAGDALDRQSVIA
jgi:hypothetical protein